MLADGSKATAGSGAPAINARTSTDGRTTLASPASTTADIKAL